MIRRGVPVIYRNGQYSIVPLIQKFVIKNSAGVILDTYSPAEIDEAVQTVDDMAQSDGCFSAVA